MTETVSVLLKIFSSVLAANALIFYLLWKLTAQRSFKSGFYVWLSLMVSFFLQSIFQEPSTEMYFAFATGLGSSFFLGQMIYESLHLRLRARDLKVSFILILLGAVVWLVSGHFTVAAVLACVAISWPQAVAAHKLMIHSRGKGHYKIFSVLLLLNVLQTLDYPLLRFHPTGAILMYSITLGLAFLLSVFLPAFLMKEMCLHASFELEKEVRERTAAVTLLSEENRALIGILFHDLATPLTFFEFAVRHFRPDSVQNLSPDLYKKNYQKLMNSLNVMREILGKVKSLQEIRAGKKELSLEPVDPVEVTHEVVQLFEDRLTAKNLQINIESYLPPNRRIQADRSLLKYEILGNLISNAIKFSPENRLVDIWILHESKECVSICIRDYGVGIPTEILNHLFDFNVRTNRPGTQAETGTGMGLPLAKTCLQMMSGTIDVETFSYEMGVSGPGTTFTLRFQAA